MIKVGSDFSGVGAFDFALKRLEIKYQNVFACDIDKYAKISYEANHSADNFYENVYNRPIPCESLDIYMTSPPCQAFSIAGNRQGEQDSRGVLFYNSVEFIRQNKPKVFIFENVKGLLSADKGKIFKKWIDHLSDGFVNNIDNSFLCDNNALPYNIFYNVLNSKDYGVPQNRERIFIVGIRKDINFNYIFPGSTDTSKRLKDVLLDNVEQKYFIKDFRLKNIKLNLDNSNKLQSVGELSNEKYDKAHRIAKAVYHENGISPTIHTMGGGNLEPKIMLEGNVNPSGNGMNGNVYNSNGLCPTLTTNKGEGIKINEMKKIRKLTPLECWRLQGFNDNEFYNAQNKGISNSQLYKQAGNSITVNVLSEIIRNLLPIFFTLQTKK